jgi:Cu/Ag efflux protein CusF
MEMPFKVKDAAMLSSLKVGMPVRFTLQQDDQGKYLIIAIAKR